jgi:hypothetical protein
MWRIELGSGIGRQIHPVAQRSSGNACTSAGRSLKIFMQAFRVFCAFRARA